MKLTRLIYVISVVIVAVWLLGIFLKFAAWLISGLFYVAAIIVIIGLISAYIDTKHPRH